METQLYKKTFYTKGSFYENKHNIRDKALAQVNDSFITYEKPVNIISIIEEWSEDSDTLFLTVYFN